jgi:hypothetical protein
MKRGIMLSAMAMSATLVAAIAHADPRGESSPPEALTPEQIEAQRVQTVADMEAWLRRLTGRLRYEGIEEVPPEYCVYGPSGRTCSASKPREVRGKWDCVGVGTGPGVHCVFGSTAPRRDVWQPNMDAPTMILFGIDPDTPQLRYMRFDEDGIAYEAVGELRGNTVQFRKACRHGPVSDCTEIFKIEAPDGKPVRVTMDWISAGAQYNSIALLQFKLRALPDDQSGEAVHPADPGAASRR